MCFFVFSAGWTPSGRNATPGSAIVDTSRIQYHNEHDPLKTRGDSRHGFGGGAQDSRRRRPGRSRQHLVCLLPGLGKCGCRAIWSQYLSDHRRKIIVFALLSIHCHAEKQRSRPFVFPGSPDALPAIPNLPKQLVKPPHACNDGFRGKIAGWVGDGIPQLIDGHHVLLGSVRRQIRFPRPHFAPASMLGNWHVCFSR
jgi:hypothetical protein